MHGRGAKGPSKFNLSNDGTIQYDSGIFSKIAYPMSNAQLTSASGPGHLKVPPVALREIFETEDSNFIYGLCSIATRAQQSSKKTNVGQDRTRIPSEVIRAALFYLHSQKNQHSKLLELITTSIDSQIEALASNSNRPAASPPYAGSDSATVYGLMNDDALCTHMVSCLFNMLCCPWLQGLFKAHTDEMVVASTTTKKENTTCGVSSRMAFLTKSEDVAKPIRPSLLVLQGRSATPEKTRDLVKEEANNATTPPNGGGVKSNPFLTGAFNKTNTNITSPSTSTISSPLNNNSNSGAAEKGEETPLSPILVVCQQVLAALSATGAQLPSGFRNILQHAINAGVHSKLAVKEAFDAAFVSFLVNQLILPVMSDPCKFGMLSVDALGVDNSVSLFRAASLVLRLLAKQEQVKGKTATPEEVKACLLGMKIKGLDGAAADVAALSSFLLKLKETKPLAEFLDKATMDDSSTADEGVVELTVKHPLELQTWSLQVLYDALSHHLPEVLALPKVKKNAMLVSKLQRHVEAAYPTVPTVAFTDQQGWLLCGEADTNPLKRLYAVLKDKKIFLLKIKGDHTPQTVLFLNEKCDITYGASHAVGHVATEIADEATADEHFPMRLIDPFLGTYHLRAKTAELRKQWVQRIERAIHGSTSVSSPLKDHARMESIDDEEEKSFIGENSSSSVLETSTATDSGLKEVKDFLTTATRLNQVIGESSPDLKPPVKRVSKVVPKTTPGRSSVSKQRGSTVQAPIKKVSTIVDSDSSSSGVVTGCSNGVARSPGRKSTLSKRTSTMASAAKRVSSSFKKRLSALSTDAKRTSVLKEKTAIPSTIAESPAGGSEEKEVKEKPTSTLAGLTKTFGAASLTNHHKPFYSGPVATKRPSAMASCSAGSVAAKFGGAKWNKTPTTSATTSAATATVETTVSKSTNAATSASAASVSSSASASTVTTATLAAVTTLSMAETVSTATTVMKAAKRFGGGTAPCPVCSKTAYPFESTQHEGVSYHKLCFKCQNCTSKLISGTLIGTVDGKLLCKICLAAVTPSTTACTSAAADGPTDGVAATTEKEKEDKPKPRGSVKPVPRKSVNASAVTIGPAATENKEKEEKTKPRGSVKPVPKKLRPSIMFPRPDSSAAISKRPSCSITRGSISSSQTTSKQKQESDEQSEELRSQSAQPHKRVSTNKRTVVAAPAGGRGRGSIVGRGKVRTSVSVAKNAPLFARKSITARKAFEDKEKSKKAAEEKEKEAADSKNAVDVKKLKEDREEKKKEGELKDDVAIIMAMPGQDEKLAKVSHFSSRSMGADAKFKGAKAMQDMIAASNAGNAAKATFGGEGEDEDNKKKVEEEEEKKLKEEADKKESEKKKEEEETKKKADVEEKKKAEEEAKKKEEVEGKKKADAEEKKKEEEEARKKADVVEKKEEEKKEEEKKKEEEEAKKKADAEGKKKEEEQKEEEKKKDEEEARKKADVVEKKKEEEKKEAEKKKEEKDKNEKKEKAQRKGLSVFDNLPTTDDNNDEPVKKTAPLSLKEKGAILANVALGGGPRVTRSSTKKATEEGMQKKEDAEPYISTVEIAANKKEKEKAEETAIKAKIEEAKVAASTSTSSSSADAAKVAALKAEKAAAKAKAEKEGSINGESDKDEKELGCCSSKTPGKVGALGAKLKGMNIPMGGPPGDIMAALKAKLKANASAKEEGVEEEADKDAGENNNGMSHLTTGRAKIATGIKKKKPVKARPVFKPIA